MCVLGPCDSPGTSMRSSLAVDRRTGLASRPLATQIRALGSRTCLPFESTTTNETDAPGFVVGSSGDDGDVVPG